MPDSLLKVALAQIAPVWLDRAATLAKVIARIDEAAALGCGLVAFGEALVPGYPFWIEWTDGARFDSAAQKDLFALYADQAVTIEAGHLDGVRAAAARGGIAVMLGIVERPRDRSGHSLYCSCVYIDAAGVIGSVHRKLVPTYEERLVWSPGDGHGLTVHRLGAFTLGGLNCFENWLPLARAALHAQGEDLHVAIWPGNRRNTEALTPVIAQEGRSFALSVSAVLTRADIPARSPRRRHAGAVSGGLGRRRIMPRRPRRVMGHRAAHRQRGAAGRDARSRRSPPRPAELRSIGPLCAPRRDAADDRPHAAVGHRLHGGIVAVACAAAPKTSSRTGAVSCHRVAAARRLKRDGAPEQNHLRLSRAAARAADSRSIRSRLQDRE